MERIYDVLSRRMKDRYDVFGGLPDTIEDEWIENIEELEQQDGFHNSDKKHKKSHFALPSTDR